MPEVTPKEELLLLGGVDYERRTSKPTVTIGPKPLVDLGKPPSDRGSDYESLQGSQEELAGVERVYRKKVGPHDITILQGADATEEEFRTRSTRHSYLHLATHGFFASPRIRSALQRSATQLPHADMLTQQSISGYHPGLLSGVVLAGANRPDPDRDDGILTASEVSSLDFRGVDLAVLSACETGLGQVAGGEGLLGLQRAFHVAGARTVVASLWKVDDSATQALDGTFLCEHVGREDGHTRSPPRGSTVDAAWRESG